MILHFFFLIDINIVPISCHLISQTWISFLSKTYFLILTALFTNPMDFLLLAGAAFRDHSQLKGFFHATGIVPLKVRNGSAIGLVNGVANSTIPRANGFFC